ncbi:MAG TPA: MarR family transcriptional regulator [Rhodanobacter sp.]|jgi:Transcriptional regulators
MDQGIGRVNQIIPKMPAAQARLCRLLLIVGGRLQHELEAIVKPYRINHSEFTTLMILYSRPDGCSTPGELCDLATQGATNMTRIANALLKRGLISRHGNAGDRRRVVIRITAAGRRFAQTLLPPMFPRIADAFTGFNAGERDELRRLLCKLAANLDQMDSGVTP